jgi:hypothetical protein
MAKWAEEGSGVQAKEAGPDISDIQTNPDIPGPDVGGDAKPSGDKEPEIRFHPETRNEADALSPSHETRHPKQTRNLEP